MADALKGPQPWVDFPVRRRVDAIVNLVRALQYCHSKKVKHRDVKPDNICFADEDFLDLLLIDFGVATNAEATLTSFAGTPAFMAPEYQKNKRYFNESTEVYSVGVVIVALLTGLTKRDSVGPYSIRSPR